MLESEPAPAPVEAEEEVNDETPAPVEEPNVEETKLEALVVAELEVEALKIEEPAPVEPEVAAPTDSEVPKDIALEAAEDDGRTDTGPPAAVGGGDDRTGTPEAVRGADGTIESDAPGSLLEDVLDEKNLFRKTYFRASWKSSDYRPFLLRPIGGLKIYAR